MKDHLPCRAKQLLIRGIGGDQLMFDEEMDEGTEQYRGLT